MGLSLDKSVKEKFKDYNIDYGCGKIIGEATITDCILVDEEFDENLQKINRDIYGRSSHILVLWNYGGKNEI